MTIVRRSLDLENKSVLIETPKGEQIELDLTQASPGRWQTEFTGSGNGLYRLSDGLMSTVFALGPSAPKEFENTIASAKPLEPLLAKTKGVAVALHEISSPKIRLVHSGRTAGGRDWIGLTPRSAYITTDITSRPLLPAWMLLLISAMLIVWAWRIESR